MPNVDFEPLLLLLPIYLVVSASLYWFLMRPRRRNIPVQAQVMRVELEENSKTGLLARFWFYIWFGGAGGLDTVRLTAFFLEVEFLNPQKEVQRERFDVYSSLLRNLTYPLKWYGLFLTPRKIKALLEKNIGTQVTLWVVPDEPQIVRMRPYNFVLWCTLYVLLSLAVATSLVLSRNHMPA